MMYMHAKNFRLLMYVRNVNSKKDTGFISSVDM